MPVKSVFKWRGWLVSLPVVIAFLCSRGEFEHDTVTWAIGGPVFLAAVALRIWAQCHLGYRLRVHKVLTETGPYHYSRNPIYIANITMIGALVGLMELPWLVAPAVVWCFLVYSAVVRYEEHRLLVNFGDAYRQFTRMIPRWFGWRGALADDGVRTRRYLGAAFCAEVHCLLFLLLPALKEMVS
ncbi:MAG TPA: isoprenylcysteine carboxylmethyltransferase family protein [Phycisphaerae bacterium]|nr:isoprenylcysteine carboxylmethyltransferase family protein [Phycisphaerae bacterium]HUX17499.1 isoprenylcysteine carboxylmethyltransferase family protein [Phycisphaerae bacterium]